MTRTLAELLERWNDFLVPKFGLSLATEAEIQDAEVSTDCQLFIQSRELEECLGEQPWFCQNEKINGLDWLLKDDNWQKLKNRKYAPRETAKEEAAVIFQPKRRRKYVSSDVYTVEDFRTATPFTEAIRERLAYGENVKVTLAPNCEDVLINFRTEEQARRDLDEMNENVIASVAGEIASEMGVEIPRHGFCIYPVLTGVKEEI